MFKLHEVRSLIENGLSEAISDGDSDTEEVYDLETTVTGAGELEADFITYSSGKESHDKYKITIELIE